MNYSGRIAPSPTGAQHLGNARTYLVAWLHARSNKGRLLLRIEDLDTPRTKIGAEKQIFDDLNWLGLDWDHSSNELEFIRQSERTHRYTEVLDFLKSKELVYPCLCSRGEIEGSASAPHESFVDGVVYSGKCSVHNAADAKSFDQQGLKYAWRFRFPQTTRFTWTDHFAGEQSLIPSITLGDFVVARNYGPVAYQLAVVVDDHDTGVSWVVRGNDLIYSTYRQLAIYNALNWAPPNWLHVPLVVGKDGRRLAKRHGDTRLSHYREIGTKPEELLGILAWSLKLTDRRSPLSTNEILKLAENKPHWLTEVPMEPFTWTY